MNTDEKEQISKKFLTLVEIMERLRGKNGCPWDIEQDHKSLMPYLIEEAYEVLESIEENNPVKMCEELGDLMLQIVFHAQIAKEAGEFSMTGVLDSINEKLVRRHPHIFSDVTVETPEQVKKNWEEIKLKEKGGARRKSLMSGIPKAMPSMLYARRLQERAAGVGFDWPAIDGVFDKLHEEILELKEVAHTKDREKITDEMGDLLFGLVNIARWLDVNPEEALRRTSAKFVKRFAFIEEHARRAGIDISGMSLDEMENIWQDAKNKD